MKTLWLDAEVQRGEFTLSTVGDIKVCCTKPWCVTGLTFVSWDKGMPRPVLRLVGMRIDFELSLDTVALHTLRTGAPWPTAIYVDADAWFTVIPHDCYGSSDMTVRVHWERVSGPVDHAAVQALLWGRPE